MDEDAREENRVTMGCMAQEPMRTVGLEVYCYPSDTRPSQTGRPKAKHPYTVRVDLLSVNGTVFGYGDTPAEAFLAAKELLPPLWRDAVQESELPIMHTVTGQLLENETGRFNTVTSAPRWAVPEFVYDWPTRPMKNFDQERAEY